MERIKNIIPLDLPTFKHDWRKTARCCLMSALLFITLTVKSSPVSLQLARQVGTDFLKNSTKLQFDESLRLAATYYTENGIPAFYIFNVTQGFVIVAADDISTPILGYSHEIPFNKHQIPTQAEAYFQDLVEQIQYGIEHRLEAEETIARQWERLKTCGRLNPYKNEVEVAPMLSDLWDQNCYYNDRCPSDAAGPCGHAMAGCISTAMGQIIRYWNYPTSGLHSVTYTPEGYPEQSVDFSAAEYDFEHMPDQLSPESNPIQIEAVATLLWHCGVAMQIEYGPNETTGYTSHIPSVMRTYFNFHPELFGEWKSDNLIWLNQVKDCLDSGYPILYSAWTYENFGHSFVCDGYDSDDLLHFNWGWSGNCNGYFALTALNVGNYQYNRHHYAVFNIHPKSSYQIQVSSNPAQGGVVSGEGTYLDGSSCTLTASPNEGYSFVNWTKDGIQVSTSPTYSFNVTENANFTANFQLNTYTISASANPAEGGMVTGGGIYEHGALCILTASANVGYSFAGWSENDVPVTSDTSYYFTVTGNANFTADFSLNTYNIAASIIPTEGGIVTGEGIYEYGSLCTLTASANAGYSFAGWSENDIPVSSDTSYCFTVTGNANFTANFSLNTYNIAASAIPTEGGVVTGEGIYEYGSPCTLTASANAGYTFAGWSENDIPVSSDTSYCFTVTGNANFTANFSLNTYNIAASINPEDGGTITGEGTYHFGETVTLSVTPNSNYVFLYWSENDEIISEDMMLTFTATRNRTLVANLTYSSVDIHEHDKIQCDIFPNPTSHVLTIQAAEPILSLEVFSSTGVLVYNQNNSLKTTEIPVGNLPCGAYFIRITYATSVTTKMFVKK